MSDTDDSPLPPQSSEVLDLVEADAAELTEFAARHHVALEKLERCQQYLKSVPPFDGSVEVWALESSTGAPALAFRHRRDGLCTRLEVPRDFLTQHLLRLLELIHES